MSAAGGSAGQAATSGARLFYDKGCEYCHTVAGQGGHRGPDLTQVGDRLSAGEITAIIDDGPGSMPAYANNLTPAEMQDIIAFLESSGGGAAQTADVSGSELP